MAFAVGVETIFVLAVARSLLLVENYHENLFINIACADSISLLTLWEKICKNLDKNIFPTFSPFRKGDIKSSLANINLAKEKINYTPLFEIDEGLEITIKSMQNL